MLGVRLCVAVLVSLAGSASALDVPLLRVQGRSLRQRPLARIVALGQCDDTSNLVLRGGGGKKKVAAIVVPKPGFIARSYSKFVSDVFNSVDLNKDGKVDINEAYQLVLTMYIQINRQAPVDPPSPHLVAALFKASDTDKSGFLSKEEFCALASTLCARAFLRVAAHKLITLVGAPMFATYLVAKFAGETVLHDFFAKYIVPPQFHAAVLNQSTARLALTIVFCASLGNFVIKGIDFWLGYFRKEGDPELDAAASRLAIGVKKPTEGKKK